MGKTIAEKILSSHSGKNVRAGDFVTCKVDFCFSQDGTSNIVIDRIGEFDTKIKMGKHGFCMVIDHNSPSPNQDISLIHNRMRGFAGKFGFTLYDIGNGICHQVIAEKGHAYPGGLILGADSHTCTLGALNCLATGVGSTDLAITIASGKNWFKVPQTVKIIIGGKFPRGVFSKDIILYIIGRLGASGCTYKSVEFSGKIIKELSMDGRFTIANMAVEFGAKAGIMEADKKTIAWLKGRTKKRLRPVFADKDAKYEKVIEFDISKLSPQVARPHTVDNVADIELASGKSIDQAFLGTCTNGRLQDLETAVKILRGRKVHPRVKFIVGPASREIYLAALRKGILGYLIESGAVVLNPGCGPCVGTHQGVPAPGETVISSANRNFKGRMGNPDAYIYLASPATVTASAIEGKIADPRKYLN
jgi:3-isopropylmalate/(R)-2-methylmalate dehydratase large subunit